MSELSKLQKHLQEVDEQLAGIASSSVPDGAADRALLATLDLLTVGALRDRCESFRRKLTDKDPVTGNPRYGPATTSKIQTALDIHARLSAMAEELALPARERLEQLLQEEKGGLGEQTAAERIEQQRIYTHHPAPPPMVPLNIFRPDISSAGGPSRGEGLMREDKEESLRLRAKADSVRTRKRTQAELDALARMQENACMREVAGMLSIPELAGPSSGSGRETTRLLRCLQALSEAAGEQERQQEQEYGMVLEPRAEQLAIALGCVRNILGNIALHPDDEKLRRIRINHPAIKEKLTKFGVPAVRLLVAVGFHARAVLAQGGPIPDEDEVEGMDSQGREEAKGKQLQQQRQQQQQQQEEEAERGEGSEWLRVEVDRALAADVSRNTSRLTLMLVMAEPPTETALGREAWKVWFDGLQSSADEIEAFEGSQ